MGDHLRMLAVVCFCFCFFCSSVKKDVFLVMFHPDFASKEFTTRFLIIDVWSCPVFYF